MMTTHPLLDAAGEALAQGEALLLALTDATYAARLPAAFNASIGGHLRHCLDHFRSLLDGLDADEINHDARQRDTEIEQVRLAALAALRAQRAALATVDVSTLARPIRARTKVSYADGPSPATWSTVEREVMYCVVHAIHHFALVGVMCGMQGVALPAGFGVAPSTVQHRQAAGPTPAAA